MVASCAGILALSWISNSVGASVDYSDDAGAAAQGEAARGAAPWAAAVVALYVSMYCLLLTFMDVKWLSREVAAVSGGAAWTAAGVAAATATGAVGGGALALGAAGFAAVLVSGNVA